MTNPEDATDRMIMGSGYMPATAATVATDLI